MIARCVHGRCMNFTNLENGICAFHQPKKSISRSNRSGITGVSYDSSRERWIIHIQTVAGRYVAYNKDFFEACCQRKAMELIHTDRRHKNEHIS